jgi:FkbM family methyltransferase
MKFREILRGVTPPFIWCLFSAVWPKKSTTRNPDENTIDLRKNIRLRIHPESRIPFEYFRSTDQAMVEELDQFLQLATGRATLLDIGALHGLFSLAFTANHPSRQALAVEASPIAFAKLLYNIHANPSCRINAEEVALSDHCGKLSMVYEWEHAVANPIEAGRSLSVPATTGNELCARKNFTPDVIKIDVEGYELSVLRGLSTILENHKPLIFIEVHPSRLRSQGLAANEVYELLARHGYSLHPDSQGDTPAPLESANQRDLRLVFSTEWPSP